MDGGVLERKKDGKFPIQYFKDTKALKDNISNEKGLKDLSLHQIFLKKKKELKDPLPPISSRKNIGLKGTPSPSIQYLLNKERGLKNFYRNPIFLSKKDG